MSLLMLKEHYRIQLKEEKLNEMREADANGRPIVVVGVIQRSDAKNQNGRIYPHDILSKEVKRYQDEVIGGGFGMGQLDHTDNPVIELDKVSHILEQIWWDGPDEKEVWGKIRLLNTPKGKIAKQIVLDGIPLGISSRAVGSVTSRDGCDYVEDDLSLICWDLVGTPSTDNAYLKLHEAREINNFDKRKVYPVKYRIKDTLKELLNK